METIICCGSKKYENINFDVLVDSFDIIVRHNMLLPNNNYGKRNSNYQILNYHVDQNRKRKVPLEEWLSVYEEEYRITKEYIESFYNYLDTPDVEFTYLQDNNTGVMQRILNENNIECQITKQLTCGLGSLAKLINNKTKPFLIGFSLQQSCRETHQYTSKSKVGISHDSLSEICILKQLHRANLVDATFCLIEDTGNLTINSSLLTPTTASLEILKGIYK